MSKSSQLDLDFINFIAEKVKNVKLPMNLSQLCREFKKKSGTSLSDTMLLYRIRNIRDKLSELDHVDIETKVKIVFALGSPVSNGFLIELKKQADVELDDHHRIIEYKKHGKGLQLKGIHIASGPSSDTEISKRMMTFLAEKSKNATSPMGGRIFLKEFLISEGILKAENNLQPRYNLLKQQIYLAPEFDQETKIRMIFVSNTKVHSRILEELRRNAVVEVDEHQRITNYEADDGSLKLKGDHKNFNLHPIKEWSKTETDKLMNFIAGRAKQTNIPISIRALCIKFVEKNGNYRTMSSVKEHIHKHLFPTISKLGSVDMETKLRMLFALSIPVDEEFLNELRKKAFLEIDEKRRITKYKANDGSLELKGDHSRSAKTKTRHAQKKRKSGVSESSENDEETEDDTEKDVEEEEVSKPNTRSGKLSKSRHSDYHFLSDSDDNSCQTSEKVKESKSKRKEKVTRKRRISYFSETSNESEDEESEEKEELEANSSIRKSGRISKQRYRDVDFDDVSFDPPKNVNESTLEKQIEKYSPRTPRVENQKRKIVGNSSDSTSSSSKSKKNGRLSDTQIGKETDKIASGTMKNDDREVVYDGPEEPPRSIEMQVKQESLSHKKVKLEDQEYKPDRSFLSNTTQNNNQNISGNKGIRSDVVKQSSENTEEMTSEKEFMKLLRGLVETLDSPILTEFQSRIDEAIEKLGNGDHKIPTEEIAMTLNTGLFILNKNATIKPPIKGESTSLRDFFLILRNTLSFLQSSSLYNFQLKLKENIKELNGQDKVVLLASIRTVLETLLLLVMP